MRTAHLLITPGLSRRQFHAVSALRPQVAGNAVKRASDNLVRAAQKAAFGKADDDDVVVKTKFVGGIAQVSLLPPYSRFSAVPPPAPLPHFFWG